MFTNTIEYALNKLIESLDGNDENELIIKESAKRAKIIIQAINVCTNTKLVGVTLEEMEKSLQLKSTLVLMNENEYNDYCRMMSVFEDIKKSLTTNGFIDKC